MIIAHEETQKLVFVTIETKQNDFFKETVSKNQVKITEYNIREKKSDSENKTLYFFTPYSSIMKPLGP